MSQMMTPEEWAGRIWLRASATQIDSKYRALAEALTEKVIADPEQAAFLIATLICSLNGE